MVLQINNSMCKDAEMEGEWHIGEKVLIEFFCVDVTQMGG